MNVFKLIFIGFILSSCSASPYVIELVASPKTARLKDGVSPPSLVINQLFTFNVNVYESKIIPKQIWCTGGNEAFFRNHYLKQKGLYYTSTKNETAATNMNCTWSCRLTYTIKPDVSQSINFELRVSVKESLNEYIAEEEYDDKSNSASRNFRASRIPAASTDADYIYCSIYKSYYGKLEHITSSKLHQDHPFTFYVDFQPTIKNYGSPKWITCNKSGKLSEVFINGVLNYAPRVGERVYEAKIPFATSTMTAKWSCKLTVSGTAPVTYQFDVVVKIPASSTPASPVATPVPANVNIVAAVNNKDINTNMPSSGINNSQDENKSDSTPLNGNGGNKNHSVLPMGETDSSRVDNRATIQEITVQFYKNVRFEHKYNVEVPSTLKLGTPFRIKIENLENYDNFYTRIMCNYYLNIHHGYITSTLQRVNNHFLSQDNKNITQDMGTKWQCHVYDVNNKEEIIHFNVTIQKTDGNYISLFVNDERMNITYLEIDEKKEMNFNAKAEYNYNEGELVKIKCMKIEGNLIRKELSFYNGSKIFQTRYQSTKADETMYIKLTKQHHASFIDCTVKDIYKSMEYTLRLLFFIHRSSLSFDEPILTVNGLTLAPTIKHEYMYEYYNGESLTILGHIANTNCKWYCLIGKDEKLEPIKNQHERINLTVTLDYTKLMKSAMDCVAGISAVNLKLNPINMFDPFIHGLSLSQTLLAYAENETNYILKYNYTGDANLNVTCVSNKSGCKWDFNSSQFIAENDSPFYSTDFSQFSGHLLMKPIKNNDESAIIKCICPNKHTFSVVMNQPREVVSTTNAGDVAEPAAASPEQKVPASDTSSIEPSMNNGGGLNDKILIGIVLGTIAIVILVVWIIVGLHKRKRKLEEVQASAINYENLPEHNDGPMPIPSQWNDYTTSPLDETYTYCEPYVEKNVEDMYAQPQPKSQRQPELLYAEVGGQEPTYADIGHESKAYVNTKKNQMREQPTYSQIQPKKLRDNAGCAPMVLPKPVNDNYASVVPRSVRMQADYTNVFKDQRYINAEGKGEYAEPAYCEVSKTK